MSKDKSEEKETPKERREPVQLLAVEPEKRSFWQRLNHSLLYGARQTFFCFATDAVEPFINKWFQNKVGDKKHGVVTNTQTVVGEVAGDFAAFGVYVGLKTFFATPVNMVISSVKDIGSPILTKMGRNSVTQWAKEHDVSEDDPRYKKRVEDYKTFQAENAVDSAIIATSATALNLLAQRQLLKNEQSYMTMFKGKLMGAGLTLVAMFASSVFFPKQTRRVEDKIEETLVNPGMKIFKGLIGVKDEPESVITKTEAGKHPLDGSIPLSPEKREGLLIMVADHAKKIDFSDASQRAALIAKQKSVYEAFIKAFDPEGPLVAAMIHEHYETLQKEHRLLAGEPDQNARDHEASTMSIQASMAHKRRDMQHFIALLDDPAFLDDVKKVLASGTLPERKNSTITQAQRDYMSESLMKKKPAGSDPSVAILDVAESQELDYKALAHALEPGGRAAHTLASELKKHLPDYDPVDIDGIAKDYMGYYQKEALTMAAEFKPGSATVQQATERAASLRNKYPAPAQEMSYTLAG